jgi:hypothetical protein
VSTCAHLAAPPLDEAQADQPGREQVKTEQHIEPPLVTDGEAPEAGEPGQRALDHPAVPAQPFTALHPAPGDPASRPAPPRGGSVTRSQLEFGQSGREAGGLSEPFQQALRDFGDFAVIR